MELDSVSAAESSSNPEKGKEHVVAHLQVKPKDASRGVSGGFLLQPLRKASKRKADTSAPVESSNQENMEPQSRMSELSNGSNTTPQQSFAENAVAPSVQTPEPRLHVFKRRKGKKRERLLQNTPSPQHSQASSQMQTSPASAPEPSSIIDDRLDDTEASQTSNPPSIDPAQIVRMALSLNENRRLNLSPGHLPPPSPGSAPLRASSAAVPSRPLPSPAGPGDHREQLRQSFARRPTSSTGSPSRREASSRALSRDRNESNADHSDVPSQFIPHAQPDIPTTFSAATLSRADKARKFIELHAEFRRLLQVLPPLQPVSTLAQNQTSLGRKYNPLQCIRNRKVRGHVQDLLDPDGAGWNDADKVKEWVDSIEAKAKSARFRVGDIAMLPVWNNSEQGKVEEADGETSFPPFNGNAMGPKSKRPKLDWIFTPAGLLADAYWLENSSNKELIENRHGMKLFPNLEIPTALRDSVSLRASFESDNLDVSGTFSSPDSNMVQSSSFHGNSSQNRENRKHRANNTSSQNSKSMGIVKRHLLGRRKNVSTAADESDDSGNESVGHEGKVSLGRRLGVNIGPLEKHMSAILKSEGSAAEEDGFAPLPSSTTYHSDGQQRRGGVSSETNGNSGDVDADVSAHVDGEGQFSSPRNSIGSDRPETPRISIDNFDRGHQANGDLFGQTSKSKQSNSRNRALKLFNRHAKDRQINKVEETDFATKPKISESEPRSEGRSSPGSSIMTGSRSNSVTNFSSPVHSRRESAINKHQETPSSKDKESTSQGSQSRFFKAGRLGELVRSELGQAVEGSSRKGAQRKDSDPSSRIRDSSTFSDADDAADSSPYLTVTSSSEKRSLSTNDLEKSNSYDPRNLPTFRSAHAPAPSEETRPSKHTDNNDHISRQMREQKSRYSGTKSRFGRLAPLSIDTTPDVSPNTSTPDLASSRAKYESAQTSPRHSSGVENANSRLNKVLREPGGVGRGGLPVTGLSTVDPRSPEDTNRSNEDGTRRANEDGDFLGQSSVTGPITSKDIHRVRALLLSSGIKAQAIVRRANCVRNPSAKFLQDAAATANVSIAPQILREEHVVAARILSNGLEKAASSFETLASGFRNETCQSLHARLDDLRDRGNSDLTMSMQTCSDDADAFMARVTTTHTLAVKQVNDSVDRMIRARWRRLRWLSSAGFKVLEWLLVGIMWLIWAFVFVINIVQGTVSGVGRAVKWLFWLS